MQHPMPDPSGFGDCHNRRVVVWLHDFAKIALSVDEVGAKATLAHVDNPANHSTVFENTDGPNHRSIGEVANRFPHIVHCDSHCVVPHCYWDYKTSRP